MRYIATLFLVLMTIILVVCGILLWRKRKETNDYSRTIQAILSWVSALFTLTFIFRTWTETTTADGDFFEPEHTFVPLLIQISYFLYPLEVINPTASRPKVYACLFAPLLMLAFVGMCAGIEYTPLHTYADIWQHIGEFNVWFRLLSLVIMLSYAFALFLVPYDWRRSSADRKFIMTYATGFCLIGVLHFSIQLSHAYWLILLHQLVWMAFFFGVAYYELRERIIVSPSTQDYLKPDTASTDFVDDELWIKIMRIVEENEGWRNPDMDMSSLTKQLFSNRTYVGEAFKLHTGMTFGEYITKRRIDYVAERLKHNPDANIQELFIEAGYRHRSTAWRHFQKLKGVSPTEFAEGSK
ncbi:MAG: AraC family transcriptional regulator [Parabacteroides distasonis]|nr:AraC family transcriptional regulator [Parabacteroides distasonis]